MAASALKKASYAAITAAATSYSVLHNRAYADNSPTVEPQPTMSGLDADSLERAAKASRNINNSRLKKQIFEVMNLQEATRLAELDFEKAQYREHQAEQDIERQRKMAEEQRNLLAQQAQAKAQHLRQKDEFDRKRMQTEHETQRSQNAEFVKMQELSSERTEKARRTSEEQIQAQKRHTEKVKAEIEQETIRVNTMAEAEARALEKKLTEEQKMRTLEEELKGEKDKWLAAIHTTFKHIEDGVWVLLTDRTKLIMAVGGVTAVAAGVYTTREGARVMWGYINRILGQPSLIRESSIGKYPLLGPLSRAYNKGLKTISGSGKTESKPSLENIVLHPSLRRRIEQLAGATANTKAHQAPFLNMLYYGPPGTGKTMVAKEIARKSGLDYAMMTGGDVAPLGAEAVTKIHQIFDWAKKSKEGLLLFIDEADAFLCERNSIHMSEAQRSALNALLFRTGDQSRDVALVLATNRPGDLDSAVTDRIDEVIEFPLPGAEERAKLLTLYLDKYLSEKDDPKSWWRPFKGKKSKKIVKDLPQEVICVAARKTEGFSGREIAKLVASVQASVYGTHDCVLDSHLFMEIVNFKVAEHQQRIKIAAAGGVVKPRS